MQKGLCIAALTISVIVFVLYLLDLAMGLAGQQQLAPFNYASLVTDIVFLVASLCLGLMSFFTLREQV